MIRYHEEGGSKEADLLRDADSISFLEINVPFFISRIPEHLTKEGVREKLDYMFGRVGSQKAQDLAKPFYEKARADLGRVED